MMEVNNVQEIAEKLAKVSDVYASRFSIDRDRDWYLLKIQEELGELTQQHLKVSGRGRSTTPEVERKKLEEEWADLFAMVVLYARHNEIDVVQALDEKWFHHLGKNNDKGEPQ